MRALLDSLERHASHCPPMVLSVGKGWERLPPSRARRPKRALKEFSNHPRSPNDTSSFSEFFIQAVSSAPSFKSIRRVRIEKSIARTFARGGGPGTVETDGIEYGPTFRGSLWCSMTTELNVLRPHQLGALLTLNEAAALLSLSLSTLRRLMRQVVLQPVFISVRCPRFQSSKWAEFRLRGIRRPADSDSKSTA